MDRTRQYFDWAKQVIDQVRGTNPRLERRFEQPLGGGNFVARSLVAARMNCAAVRL